MEVLGIMGMTFGGAAMAFALAAMGKVTQLENKLKEAGLLKGED